MDVLDQDLHQWRQLCWAGAGVGVGVGVRWLLRWRPTMVGLMDLQSLC